MTAGPTEPPSLPSALFVWRSGRGGLYRLVAHVLIRLLILLPLPPQLQMGALLFPVSLLWPLVTARPVEGVNEGPAETAAEALLARSFPLNDGLSGVSPRRWESGLVVRTDIVMSGNTAIVAIGGGKAVLVDLTNPATPRITGEIAGVGTRLTLTESNLLVSTYRTYLGNMNNPLQGLHVATFAPGTFITGIRPNPIVVSAANEVFSDVDLDYRLIPRDPEVTSAEVTIDIRGGAQVASIPGSLDETGRGTVTWPSGTVVDLSRTYEAHARVTTVTGPVNAFPKRLPLDRVPLAMIKKDRLLRIQVALPEQGLFEENRYAVEVYVGSGGSFPSTPTFKVTSEQIRQAFPNIEQSWPSQEDNPEVTREWFTRKLDTMALPPGTDTTIRRKAFEIATVLGHYAPVRVVVRSETSEQELMRKEEDVTEDASISELLTTINLDIRRAGGEPLAPRAFAASASPRWGIGEAIEKLAGMTARAIIYMNDLNARYNVNVLKGLYDGFKETLEGDIETVVFLKTAFTQSPTKTARAIGEFFKSIWEAIPSQASLVGWVATLFEKADQFNPRLDEALLFATETGAYYYGYLSGFVLEMALTTALIAGGLAAVTAEVEGIGAAMAPHVRLALTYIRTPIWLAQIAKRVAVAIRALGYMFQGLARAGRLVRTFAGETLRFVLQYRAELVTFFDKYKKLSLVLEALGEVMTVSRQAAVRALYWLGIVDRMAEEAGVRFAYFIRNKTASVADQWLTRWTGLANGKRAVKDAFEAYDRIDEAAEGVADVLVLAANIEPPPGVQNYAKGFVSKYGETTGTALGGLKRTLADDRYSDEVLARTVRAHADAAPVGGFSAEAVEGSARLLRDAGAPLDDVERATESLLQLDRTKMDDNFRFLRDAETTPDDVEGFYALARDGVGCRLISGRP